MLKTGPVWRGCDLVNPLSWLGKRGGCVDLLTFHKPSLDWCTSLDKIWSRKVHNAFAVARHLEAIFPTDFVLCIDQQIRQGQCRHDFVELWL